MDTVSAKFDKSGTLCAALMNPYPCQTMLNYVSYFTLFDIKMVPFRRQTGHPGVTLVGWELWFREGRFGSKVGAPNTLKSDLKKTRMCSIWGQSDPLWSQTYHPCSDCSLISSSQQACQVGKAFDQVDFRWSKMSQFDVNILANKLEESEMVSLPDINPNTDFILTRY